MESTTVTAPAVEEMPATRTPAADPSRPSTLQTSWHTALMGRLEDIGWLDRAGDALARVVDPITTGGTGARVKDLLHGRPLGHALHPILSDLPLGMWSAATLLDVAGEDRAAGILGAAGAASSVATAATGVADWTVTHGRERRLALLHGMVNGAALSLQMLSLVARVRGHRRRAGLLAASGLAVSGASAYIGGELVFGRGLMVDHTAWTAGPQEWRDVASLAELDDGGVRSVVVDGRGILLHRRGARVVALENACSHAGGPLAEGEVHDGTVVCPWHGSCFRLEDGAVVRGPATYPQPQLMTRVVRGRVEVRGREG